ncbi:hypothetical protein L204_105668 [Cryptococcus depauperatus]|nr:cytoplasmic protein [Cryptococcus depauperatus CBS 7855]
MPLPPTTSPVTGEKVPPYYIHANTLHFRDTNGRSLLLRGVNLSGSAKTPSGQPSHRREGFWEDAEDGKGDFSNKPLNLEDGSADVHLARLKAWGYNTLRYVFTWESLEHEGPKKYDYAYMDYVIAVLKRCKEWGFRVFMDPHQDVWSRFSGGSGAPIWTIYACAIDPHHFTPTASAYLQCEWPNAQAPKPKEFPIMLWSTNYTRLANQTIWTMFFAGKTFAPKCIIDGKNIQDFLQDHFIDAVCELVSRIAEKASDLLDECVIGWDSINEPHEGFIGYKDLSVIPAEQQLKKGPSPTPIESLRLGMGEAQEVQVWKFGAMGPYRASNITIDPEGVKMWLSEEDDEKRGGGKWGWTRGPDWKMGFCIWAQHGVWDPMSSNLTDSHYFSRIPTDPSHEIDFVSDFWAFHWLAFSSRIRMLHPESIQFIQAPVFHAPPKLPQSFLKGRVCLAPHFYDGLTLMTRHWNWFNADAVGLRRKKYWNIIQAVRVGDGPIRNMIQGELSILKQDTINILGEYPTIIGEIGTSYDMDGKKAYGYVDGGRGEGDYSSQRKAQDCSLNACDGPNCLNYTVWTYVPDNSHEWGDNWNGEDLSIWSADDLQQKQEQNVSSSAISSLPQSSAATLTVPLSSTKPKYSLSLIQAGEFQPQLILDGARAVDAFCRPFPIASVGTPERIDFDINSTKFTYSVRVRPDDVANDEVYTEIYVPFVHYAARLEEASSSSRSSQAVSEAGDDDITVASRNVSMINLIDDEGAAKAKDTSSISIQPISPAASLYLDISINVSHGRTEVQAQTLKWYYQVPKIEEVYTIEIKRNGGAMRRETDFVQERSWFDVCPQCVIN